MHLIAEKRWIHHSVSLFQIHNGYIVEEAAGQENRELSTCIYYKTAMEAAEAYQKATAQNSSMPNLDAVPLYEKAI